MMTFIVNLEFPGVEKDLEWRKNFVKGLDYYLRKAVPHAHSYETSFVGHDLLYEVVEDE